MTPVVIIIGAGISGLASLTKLYENGFRNIIVLEAENRIGGRINTVPFGKSVVDMGAEWCQGDVDNVVYELAKKYDVLASSDPEFELEFRYSNGTLVKSSKRKKLENLVYDIVKYKFDELKKFKGSVGFWFTTTIKEIVSNVKYYNDIEPELVDQFLDYVEKFLVSCASFDSWYEVSFNFSYKLPVGDQYLHWKDRGYKTIIDIILKKFPNQKNKSPVEKNIFLNKTVWNIDWNRKGHLAQIKIKCVDGSIYRADHVIITTSVGVLKERHMGMFNPPLPQRKVKAIEGLMIGTVDKIFLEFRKPFWDKDWSGLFTFWTTEDLIEIKKTSFDWLNELMGVVVVENPRLKNVLCAWVGGPSARRIELLPDDTVKNGLIYLLRKTMPYKDIPEPIGFLRSAWYLNKNFRGSWSHRTLTTSLMNTSAADLAYPLKNVHGMPIIQFAGEATHDYYFSTVNGAIESGWREALRLIDFYKND